MNPGDMLLDDLDLADTWYENDIKGELNSVRATQLRYSLCNKLAADWQKFVVNCATEAGVSTNNLGNCWPNQIRREYGLAGVADPFGAVNHQDMSIFGVLNPVRNAIDHGQEPSAPSNSDLELWISSLRNLASSFMQ